MLQTSLCYLEQDGKYLMLHRVKKENDINHDKWIGIGGKFEEGESPEECALREFREETGLTPTDLAYRGIVTFSSDEYPAEEMHLFSATRFTGTLTSCDEGDLEWIEKERLLNCKIWEGDKIFLRLLPQPTPFFYLDLRYEKDALVSAVLNGEKIK